MKKGKRKNDKQVTFRLPFIDLITLDSYAESLGMNRSAYINYCLQKEFSKESEEEEKAETKKEREEERARLIQAFSELNSIVYRSSIASLSAIKKLLITVFPEKETRITRIFREEIDRVNKRGDN